MTNPPTTDRERAMLACASGGPYSVDAYDFLSEALDFALVRLGLKKKPKHVDAAQLVQGFHALAADKFGWLAQATLAMWGIRENHDIGVVVFRLIEADILQRQPHDRIEDFDGLPPLNAALSRLAQEHVAGLGIA